MGETAALNYLVSVDAGLVCNDAESGSGISRENGIRSSAADTCRKMYWKRNEKP